MEILSPGRRVNAGAITLALMTFASASVPAAAQSTGTSWWQKIEAGVDLATAKQALLQRQGAKFVALSEECDYDQVLATVREGAKNLAMIKDLDKEKNGGRWGLPSIDVKQMALHVAELYAHTKTMVSEKKGILENIEQICQAGVQADEVKRQLDLVNMAHENTSKQFSKIFGDFKVDTVSRADTANQIGTDWEVMFQNVTVRGALGQDAEYREAMDILRTSHEAANEYRERLNSIRKLLALTYVQLHLHTNDQGICPGSQALPPLPDAEDLDLGNGIIRKSCGPRTMEDTRPILTQIENLRAQAMAITLAAQARVLLAQSVDLTAKSADYKSTFFKDKSVTAAGF